jgi:hypothetical protein
MLRWSRQGSRQASKEEKLHPRHAYSLVLHLLHTFLSSVHFTYLFPPHDDNNSLPAATPSATLLRSSPPPGLQAATPQARWLWRSGVIIALVWEHPEWRRRETSLAYSRALSFFLFPNCYSLVSCYCCHTVIEIHQAMCDSL